MNTALPPCPNGWEYKDEAGYSLELVRKRTKNLLLVIRMSSQVGKLNAAMDSRQVHAAFFEDMTPSGFAYYAGHYRGEKLRCLQEYEVHVPADPRVGHTAATVVAEMGDFATRLEATFVTVDYLLSLNGPVGNVAKLIHYVQVCAALFVEFLEIHPFANGNGHMARMMILALLARRDIYPTRRWNIDPRPLDPPYSNLIKRYRDGDKEPLVRFIIDAL